MMKWNPREAYGVVAVLAAVAAILQLADRDWFRGATGLVLAALMTVAATGFPERSAANKRIYSGLLYAVIALLIIQIFVVCGSPQPTARGDDQDAVKVHVVLF